MRSYSSLLVLLFVGMSLLSCKHSATDRIDEELTAFMGKKIEFPSDSMLYMGDTVGTFHREKYMYVVYTDSSSCSDCAINHFSDWADIELQEYCEKGLLSYVFIVNPSRVMKDRIVKKISEDSLFRSSVFVDTTGCFERSNPALPRHNMMHTFLVNDSSEVVLVGNPITNKKIKGLLKEIIL